MTGFVPVRWSGMVLLACLSLLLYYVGYRRQDLVVTVSCLALLGLCLLLIVAVLGTFWVLRRRLRTFLHHSLGEGKQRLLVGRPFLLPLGFSLPYHILVEIDWRWTVPTDAKVRLVKTVDGWMEEIVFERRCLVQSVERCLEVRDVLGVASLRKSFKSEVCLEVLPAPSLMDAQTFVTSMHAGDDISDPSGEPVGDRMDMRRYAAGDPPRFILWKVYARSGKLMVRIPEHALTPTRRTCAYLVAGPGDEECAGLTRSILEKGVLGAGWRFGADGSEAHATGIEESLTLLARSGNPLTKPRGLRAFLEQARRDGYQSCLVLLPGGYGPWILEVERGLKAGGLQVSLLVVDAAPPAPPAPALARWVPHWDKLSRWLLAPGQEDLVKEPRKVISRFSQSGHRTLVYSNTTRQVRQYVQGRKG